MDEESRKILAGEKKGARTHFAACGGNLVHLGHLVYLVFLVSLVSLKKTNKINHTN